MPHTRKGYTPEQESVYGCNEATRGQAAKKGRGADLKKHGPVVAEIKVLGEVFGGHDESEGVGT